MNKFKLVLFVFVIGFASVSCNKEIKSPEQLNQENIISIQNTLMDNNWNFSNTEVIIKHETRAFPFLSNLADENGMIQAGIYDAHDIYGDNSQHSFMRFLFGRDKISIDSAGLGDFNHFATYFLMTTNKLWIKSSDAKLSSRLQYSYSAESGMFTCSSSNLRNDKVVSILDKIVTNAILNGTPNKIADAFTEKIIENISVKDTIASLLYDIIYGKVDYINQNSEIIAEKVAEKVVDKIAEIDWEEIVYNKLVTLLEELKVENPEAVAADLAFKIENKIQTLVSEQMIYDAIFPYIQNFKDETLTNLVPILSEVIYKVISVVMTEDRIVTKIEPIWEEYSEVDSLKITQVADTLGTVVTHHFFDSNSLSLKLIPFVTDLQNTPVYKLSKLSQNIIDSVLIPVIDRINTHFPGANIEPNWNKVKPAITSSLIIIKSSISSLTPEQAASSLANTIIALINKEMSEGFALGLFYLQEIPADQASLIISAWIINIIDIAEPQIVAFIETELNKIVDKFNAEEVSKLIAAKIHQKIIDVFSEENIYSLIFPILDSIANINVEASAKKITEWLFDLDIIKDNLNQETVINKISDIINQLIIDKIDAHNIAQKLTEAIMSSNIVEGIDSTFLKKIITIKTYEFLLTISNSLNAVESVEVKLIIKG